MVGQQKVRLLSVASFYSMRNVRPTAPHLAPCVSLLRESRFDMSTDFEPCAGAARFQQSNPPVLQAATLRCVYNFAVYSMPRAFPSVASTLLALPYE